MAKDAGSLAWVAAISLCCLIAAGPARASAGSDLETASRLSAGAFSLLRSVKIRVPSDAARGILGPIAKLAADSELLRRSLERGDRKAAALAMADVVADAATIGPLAAKNPGALDPRKWGQLKEDIAALEARVPPAPLRREARSGSDDEVSGADADSRGSPDGHPGPRIKMASRVIRGDRVRMKGWLEGWALTSAGIYRDERMVKSFEVAGVPGLQRVNFDITLERVTPGEVLRVVDDLGRTAEAEVAPAVSVTPHSPRARDKIVELSPSGAPSGSWPSGLGPPGRNTAEIPTRSGASALSAPRSGPALNVPGQMRISILGVTRAPGGAGKLRVIGHIAGRGIRRAGIYVDGRMVVRIPLSPGGMTAFDANFPMAGREATIRAYGNGSGFVEASINSARSPIPLYDAPFARGLSLDPSRR